MRVLKKLSGLFLVITIFDTGCLRILGGDLENQKGKAIVQQNHVPRVAPSTLMNDLRRKIKKQPKISSKELALYANNLLVQKGFNYEIDSQEIVEANKHPKRVSTKSDKKLYAYSFQQPDGKKVQFELINSEAAMEGLCGENFFYIPCLEVSKREILIVADGKPCRLKRPKIFTLEKMSLVDQSMKKVLRTWEIPFQSVPIGVSQDQTKLYLNTQVDQLILEVSETGLCFKARNQVKLPRSENIYNHPTDPKDDYLSFIRFHFGNQSAIVRFSGPCT